MKSLLALGVVAVLISSSTGCCLLDTLLCWDHCWWGGCHGYGCEPVPHAACASQRVCCEPCDCCGTYTGPPHDYYGLGHGGGTYMGEEVWQDAGPVHHQGVPTPAETVPAPPRSTQRMPMPQHGRPAQHGNWY